MDSDEKAVHLGTRNHVLVTESYVARGTVIPCPGRLSDLLRGLSRATVVLHDAEADSLTGEVPARYDIMHVSLRSLLLAHEYVALGGDEHQRALLGNNPRLAVLITMSGLPGLHVRGHVSADAIERDERFLAVMDPLIRGDRPRAQVVAEHLGKLPYVLVNRERLDSVMVVGGPSRVGESET